MKKEMITNVVEIVLRPDQAHILNEPAATSPAPNPRRKKKGASRAAELAEAAMAGALPELADYSTYKALRVRVALLRDPDWDLKNAPQMTCSADIYRLLRHLSLETQENFVVVLLDAKHRVIGIYDAFRGSSNSVEVHPRDLFRPVVVAGAIACVVAHNHPSGEPEPSREDQRLTQRLVEAGDLLGVPVLDHIIIGAGGYVSLADRGQI